MTASESNPERESAIQRRRVELGGRIRTKRRDAGLSQETLAERAGVERKLISRMETGTHAITLDSLIQIAAALNMSEADLLHE